MFQPYRDRLVFAPHLASKHQYPKSTLMLGILIPADVRDVIAYLSGQKPKATKAKPVKAKK
jgi:hypothetical protein